MVISMRVLFVCRANGGRSPMAEAFFNRLSKRNRASSAGVDVAAEGKSGMPANPKNVAVMGQAGYDISGHRRRQLTRAMSGKADVIVFMASRSKLPASLKGSKKVRLWRIPNPRNKNMAARRRIRNKINTKVEALIGEMG